MLSSHRAAKCCCVALFRAGGDAPALQFPAPVAPDKAPDAAFPVLRSTSVKAAIARRAGVCRLWIPLPRSGRMQASAFGCSAQFCVSASRK